MSDLCSPFSPLLLRSGFVQLTDDRDSRFVLCLVLSVRLFVAQQTVWVEKGSAVDRGVFTKDEGNGLFTFEVISI